MSDPTNAMTQEQLVHNATMKLASVVGMEHYGNILMAVEEIVKAAQTYKVYGADTKIGDK